MAAQFFACIDWQRPWLAPLLPAARELLAAADWRVALNDAAMKAGLCNHRGLPLHFVPQAALPTGMGYEEFISAEGAVPTRENLHDFFNALVWLTFPQIKKQLNALQAAEVARHAASLADSVRASIGAAVGSELDGNAAYPLGVATVLSTDILKGSRGKLRDATTIFDENAALLICSDLDWAESLRAHRWRDALLLQRDAVGHSAQVFLFGHAIMEKLVTPYKAITTHTWLVPASADFFSMSPAQQLAWIDTAVAQQLQGGLVTADFSPLPVLGVPGWWEGQDEAFYADAQVFRPLRLKA